MSVIQNRSASIAPPFPGASTTGVSTVNSTTLAHVPGGVQAVATSSTSTSFVVDPSLYGTYVVAQAITSDCQYGFKWGSAATLTWNAVSSIDGGGIITSNAARGGTLIAGLPREFLIPSRPSGLPSNQKLYLSVVCQGAGQFELSVSE